MVVLLLVVSGGVLSGECGCSLLGSPELEVWVSVVGVNVGDVRVVDVVDVLCSLLSEADG